MNPILNCSDIHGSDAGSGARGNFHLKARKDIRQTNNISDIHGSDANSLTRDFYKQNISKVNLNKQRKTLDDYKDFNGP